MHPVVRPSILVVRVVGAPIAIVGVALGRVSGSGRSVHAMVLVLVGIESLSIAGRGGRAVAMVWVAGGPSWAVVAGVGGRGLG